MFLIENCKKSYRHFQSVAIDNQAINALSKRISELNFMTPKWQDDFCFKGDPERSLSWIFLYNAVNYCYWPRSGPRWIAQAGGRTYGDDDEAKGMMAVLARAMENGVPFDDPKWLMQMDIDDFKPFFYPVASSGELPLLDLRVNSLKEMGKAFQTYGGAIGMLTTAQFNAEQLVLLLLDACPSWRDISQYNGIELPFCKRAWLTAAMCFGRFQDDPTRRITNPESIPAFADYRLPQFLRETGVLKYSSDLSKHIDAQVELTYGSNEEIEIRAATIIAMDRLQEAINANGTSVTALELDHVIWNAAVNSQDKLKPHHRTLTIGY